MKPPLPVAVEIVEPPIDLQKWARDYCRRVLELEAIEVDESSCGIGLPGQQLSIDRRRHSNVDRISL